MDGVLCVYKLSTCYFNFDVNTKSSYSVGPVVRTAFNLNGG